MKKFLTLILTLLCAVCAGAAVLSACGGAEPEAVYYLSRGDVYTAEADIPASLRFAKSGDVYTLTVDLSEGETFTVNRLGGEALGFSALFSARTELAEGENGAIRVEQSGAYAFTLQEDTLSYTFTAKEEDDDPDDPVPPPASTAVTGVRLDRASLSLELGEETALTATVLPETAANKNVFWDSDNESVATVTNGTVKAVGYGTATITVSTAENGFTADCTVTVIKHASALRFDAEALSLTVGGAQKTLSLRLIPDDAIGAYAVAVDGDALSVEDDGAGTLTLKGLSVGTATVTASLVEDPEITATCTVTVLAAGSVLAELRDVTAMIGEETKLTLSLENAEISSVAWSVGSEAVATIAGDGAEATLTGVDFGSTTVTAAVTAEDGEVYTATCKVLVSDDFYFIYGYGLVEEGDWQFQKYLTDRNAAERDGLLFTEQSRGVYTLTRRFTPANGFQIIFPKVGNFTQHDDTSDEDVWSKNIPSHWVAAANYYSANRSDNQYITNATEYFCVNTPGIYTVTLDLTGTKARVYLNVVSLDIASVDLTIEQGSAVLKDGEIVFGFSVSPSAAKFNENEVEVQFSSDFADYANYIACDLRVSDRKLAVSVNKKAPESFTVTLTLTIRGVSTSVDLYVLSESDEEVLVSSVTFEQEHYYVNVNQGGAKDAWQQIVKASVNQDATNRQVRYLDVTDYNAIRAQSSDTRVTVNAETGLVTGKVLGTVTIKAVALANEAISDTCLVTFYSDVIYLIGGALPGFATNLGGWEPLDSSYKSVTGTAFEEEQFIMQSPTHFRLEYTFNSKQQFQLAFCGMDDKWVGVISMKNFISAMSNAVSGWNHEYTVTSDGKSMETKALLTFIFDLDLSEHMAFWTVNVKDRETFEGALLDYDASHTELREGDAVNVKLYLLPEEGQEEISYSLDDDRNLNLTYDETTKTFTLQVQEADLSEDREVTLTVKVKGKELSIPFTVIARHHLELQWDDDYHWMGCTDEGCDYIDGEKTAHNREETLTANAEGHYTACSECGVQLGLQSHEYDCESGVFDFSEGMKKCKICQYDLFEIDGNTLVYYYGREETVQVPDEVTILGDHVFEGHTELKTLTYSSKLTKIGAYAFAGCSALTSVLLPNRISEIGGHAFDGTAATITWGRSVSITRLGEATFYGYRGTELTIPSTVTFIGPQCFAYSNLTRIVLPDKICNNLTGGNLDATRGFEGCTSLQSIVIGKGMTYLPASFFRGCSSLETVIIRGDGFYQFRADCFYGCTSIQAVYLERPLKELLTCNWLIMAGGVDTVGSGRMEEIKGKLYAYSAEQPEKDPFGEAYSNYFGYFRDWFGGCWHWDDSGWQDLSHILLWPSPSPAPVNMPLSLPPKRFF